MAILFTHAVDAGTARSSFQHTFVAPVPITVDHNEILILDGLTSLPYIAKDTTRTMHCNGTEARLVEFNIDGSAASSVADSIEYHDAAQTQETQVSSINANIVEKFAAGGQVRALVKYDMETKGPHQGTLSGQFGHRGYEIVDLTLPNNRYYHRNTAYRVTAIDTYMLDSGMEMMVIKDYRADEDQVDFTCSIHNAGIGEALSDDVTFQWIKVLVANGLEAQVAEWETTSDVDNGYLVKPSTATEGTHVLPQKMVRTVYFHVVLEGATADMSFAGQYGCIAAFHEHEGGVMGFPLPLFTDTGAIGTRADTNYTDLKADTLALTNDYWHSTTFDPVSHFWLSFFDPYGGSTSGDAIEWNSGIYATAAPTETRWEHMRLEMTRWNCRQATHIYENGYPITAAQHLDTNDAAPWEISQTMYFKRQNGTSHPVQDEPFDFSSVFTLNIEHSQRPTVWISGYGHGYPDSSQGFQNIDQAHYPRYYKDALNLAWYTNDPLAWAHTQMAAQNAMMVWPVWDGGRNSSFDLPTNMPGLGMTQARSLFWSSAIIAHANAQWTPWATDTYMDLWAQRFVTLLAHHQMPAGVFSCKRYGKESTSPPFGDGTSTGAYYWADRGTQQTKAGLALWAWRNLRTTAKSQNAAIDAMLDGTSGLMRAFDLYYPSQEGAGDEVGIQSKYIVGYNFSDYRFTNYSEYPTNPLGVDIAAYIEDSANGVHNSTYQYSGVVGIAVALGYTNHVAMLERLTDERGNGLPACETAMEAWDDRLPGGGAFAATFGGTLAYVQKENAP